MSSTQNTDTFNRIEAERHVSGAGALESLEPGAEEKEVKEYLEGILADVEQSGSSQSYDFDVWTAGGSQASVTYREEDGQLYVGATGGEAAVETVLYNAETNEYMEELEDIWF